MIYTEERKKENEEKKRWTKYKVFRNNLHQKQIKWTNKHKQKIKSI